VSDVEAQSPEPVRAGALSALIAELVRAPEPGGQWSRGLRPGDVVADRFEIERELGRGGFGVVYQARDRQLSRSVAFKAVRAGEQAALREERLLREAESAARLSHPNIVTLHDVGRCEHGPYLVLELLRGGTLAERLRHGPLSVREALRMAVKVAEGLAHAHRQGVVHRDLTPGNVFLCDDGQVKILDFGLAHAFGQRRADGGTPAYMAPEQWRCAPEDERTDVFALGVILHQALCGALPFPEDDAGKEATSPRPAPSLSIKDAPALGPLLGRLLEKDPVLRPRDGAEVLAALSLLQQELERTPSAAIAPVRQVVRSRRPVQAAAALVLVLLCGAAALSLHSRRGPKVEGAPVSVAVADFANLTGEPELDGLSGMLITSLEQSQRLSVLTRVRMLDLLRQQGRAAVEAIDEPLGREVARAAGVRALVLATIRRFDDLYAIEVKVLDPARSEYLFTLKEQGRGKSSVPGLIDRLSERTRERLRYETPAELSATRVKVADATTASFEAYQHYFRGDQLKEAIRYADAIAEYRQALAIDPRFALARYKIAYLGEFTDMAEADRRAEMERALADVDRVPAKERLLFQAWKAHLDGKNEEGHAIYARAAEAYPQDKEVQFLAGDLFLHEERYAEGLPFFERAVALDPVWVPGLMHLTDSLAFLGQGARLDARAREWVNEAPSAWAYRALSMGELMAGRPEEALQAVRRAYALDPSAFIRWHLAQALVVTERYEEEEAMGRAVLSTATTPTERKGGFWLLVEALAYQGRRREALRMADAPPPGLPEPELLRAAARLDLLLGDADPGPALEEVRRIEALISSLPARDRAMYHIGLAGDLAWLGDDAGAAEKLRQARPAEPHSSIVESLRELHVGDRERGLARLRELAGSFDLESRAAAWDALLLEAERAGRDGEVVEAADALRNLPSGLWRSWAYPRSLLAEARAQDRLGDRARARATVERLLVLWREADPEQPLLQQARALRRKLGAGT
jgi:tetratricopeptide (TPR) repeat protein